VHPADFADRRNPDPDVRLPAPVAAPDSFVYSPELTLALFAYFGTVMVVEIPWGDVLHGLLLPTFSSDPKFWAMIVAIFETKIGPYLFF
jgi:hypothetical protein